MKKNIFAFCFLLLMHVTQTHSQTNPVIDAFAPGTVLKGNVPYNNDTLQKHLLDIYLPANVKGKIPLVIFIHGVAG
jgi:hypothetical protein